MTLDEVLELALEPRHGRACAVVAARRSPRRSAARRGPPRAALDGLDPLRLARGRAALQRVPPGARPRCRRRRSRAGSPSSSGPGVLERGVIDTPPAAGRVPPDPARPAARHGDRRAAALRARRVTGSSARDSRKESRGLSPARCAATARPPLTAARKTSPPNRALRATAGSRPVAWPGPRAVIVPWWP